MTTVASTVLLGFFDKARTNHYLKLLKEQQVPATALRSQDKTQKAGKYNLYVSSDDLPKAIELIKAYEFKRALQDEERRKRSERRALNLFLIFVVIFIIYIVSTQF